MSTPRESKVEKTVSLYAEKLGMDQFKFTSPGKRAVPDRIFFFGVSTLLLEFKKKGEKPTPLQRNLLIKLQRKGTLVTWTDSMEEGIEIVHAFSKGLYFNSHYPIDR